MADATEKVAGKFPNVKFAIIDSSAAGMKGKPTNVEGLLFKEQEAGYLVGYLSGLYAKDNNVTTIGSVGGQKIPPVDHYIAGFQAGAKKADPGDQDAQRLLPGLRRPGEVQGDRAGPDRQGLEGRLPGRRPVRPRRRSTRPRRRASRASASTPTRATSAPQVFTSALKKVDVAVLNAIKGVQDDKYTGRPGRHQHVEVRRHRLRQAQRRRPRSTPTRSRGPGPASPAARSRTSRTGRVQVISMETRPRAARDHEALRADRRQRRRRLRPEARRGPRAARGERRRQVDADERPLRALHARRGRDPRRRPARAPSTRRSQAIELGIGMVHQHFMLVPVMTVAENIVLANEPRRAASCSTSSAAAARVRELSDRYGLAVDPDARVEDVTVGMQQRVEILRALYRGARILVLDEPTAVLTAQEARDLFRVLRGAARPTARRSSSSRTSSTRCSRSPTASPCCGAASASTPCRPRAPRRQSLARLMVGREVLLRVDKPPRSPRSRCSRSATSRCATTATCRRCAAPSLTVRAGEIVALAGVDGNGQSELVEAITGLRSVDAGSDQRRRART